MEKINVAIDGPAGAGKSTVARLVAKELNFLYIDTGAMYRALTFKALTEKINLEDDIDLTTLARNTRVHLVNSQEGQKVIVDDNDVSIDIRTPEVTQKVSIVAKVSGVRQEMVKLQRIMALEGGVVMDGRDIGTHVLPNAERKFFLTASLDERAKRRFLELKSKGYEVEFEELKEDIAKRDKLDEERETAPLIKADDAILIDTTGFEIEEVVQKILKHII